MKTIADILQERGRVYEQMKALSKASPDGFSAEEKEKYDRLDTAQSELKARADRMTREAELDADINANYGTPAPADTEAKGRNSASYKAALDKYLRKHQISNALEVGTTTEGGYLTHDTFDMNFREIRDHYNALRPFVEVITTTGDHNIRVETSLGSSVWLDEEAAYTDSDTAFGNVQLNAHKLGRTIKVSEELLQDSDFNLEAYLARAFGRSHGLAEEAAFIKGVGTTQPTGMIQGATTVVRSDSPLTSVTSAETLLDAYHGLPIPYRSNATWIFHDATVRVIRGLKDENDNFVWQPGLQMGQPDRVLGRPYLTSAYMGKRDDSPLSATLLFGDLSVYTVADRTGFRIQRLNELYAANGQVGFRGWSRVDGKVSQAAGLVKIVY